MNAGRDSWRQREPKRLCAGVLHIEGEVQATPAVDTRNSEVDSAKTYTVDWLFILSRACGACGSGAEVGCGSIWGPSVVHGPDRTDSLHAGNLKDTEP
jgi:hypothetical protein